MQAIIKIKEHGFFTLDNVETAKSIINYKAYPHLYEDGEMPPSFKFLGTHEIPAEAIITKPKTIKANKVNSSFLSICSVFCIYV